MAYVVATIPIYMLCIKCFQKLRRPYDLAMDRGLPELAELLASDLPPNIALVQFRKNRAKYYGVSFIVLCISYTVMKPVVHAPMHAHTHTHRARERERVCVCVT